VKKTAAAASALALGAFSTPAHADAPGGEHDWTGFYLGAGAGATSANADWEIDGGEGFVTDEDGSLEDSQGLGVLGTQAGYNHQFGSIVVGGELQYSYTNFEENTRFDGGEGASLRTELHHLGAVKARVGYAMDKVLCFATGGLAVGDVKSTYDSDGSPATKRISTEIGWVAGGGFEFAISENMSFVAEALYAEFQDDGVAQGPFFNDQFQIETSLLVGRLGLNVRF
jgi:outer membrane immunogenic protein